MALYSGVGNTGHTYIPSMLEHSSLSVNMATTVVAISVYSHKFISGVGIGIIYILLMLVIKGLSEYEQLQRVVIFFLFFMDTSNCHLTFSNLAYTCDLCWIWVTPRFLSSLMSKHRHAADYGDRRDCCLTSR